MCICPRSPARPSGSTPSHSAPPSCEGHVVLVNFWTLTCINWLRQEPYVRAWSQAYRDDGLIVIGVHTPGVLLRARHRRRAAARPRSERSTTRSPSTTTTRSGAPSPTTTGRRCTSSTRDGIIRDQHFGEGRYEQSERVIQQLLGVERELVSVEGARRGGGGRLGPPAARPRPISATGAASSFASPDGAAFDERRAYELPERLPLNHWALAGEWTIGAENVVLDQAGGSIAYPLPRARRAPRAVSSIARADSASACSSTASLPARQHGVDVDEDGTACSATAACTSSCASTARSASGRLRSRSSSPAPRRTRSRSDRRSRSRRGELSCASR